MGPDIDKRTMAFLTHWEDNVIVRMLIFGPNPGKPSSQIRRLKMTTPEIYLPKTGSGIPS